MTAKQYLPKLKIVDGKTFNESSHLVILGAGASIACMQTTSNNKKMPSMNDLFSLDGIKEIILKHSLKLEGQETFGTFFSRIYLSGENSKAIQEMEEYIYDYFSDMEIDDVPNLYDKLILSLRSKDTIATFNWDPLLILSYIRHKEVGAENFPNLLFLHGNVAEGSCYGCKVLCNYYNKICHKCNKLLSKSRLLYPVGKKNYSSDLIIKQHWEKVKDAISQAYIVTIFGYSAPESDFEAKNIFMDTYKNSKYLEQSEIEIINTGEREKTEETWKNLFFSHHYCIFKSLEDSYILKHPRRSCNNLASAYLQCNPVVENPFPNFQLVKEMHDFVSSLIQEEKRIYIK